MTMICHCDGPGCERETFGEPSHLFRTRADGRRVNVGWWHVEPDLHFHHVSCMEAWAKDVAKR